MTEIPDHVRETIRAEQENVARVCLPGGEIDGQRVMDPYCPKDHVPVSVNPRLLGSDHPMVDLLLDERVVLRHLPKPTFPEEVDAAVAHVAHHVSIVGENDHLPRAAPSPCAPAHGRRGRECADWRGGTFSGRTPRPPPERTAGRRIAVPARCPRRCRWPPRRKPPLPSRPQEPESHVRQPIRTHPRCWNGATRHRSWRTIRSGSYSLLIPHAATARNTPAGTTGTRRPPALRGRRRAPSFREDGSATRRGSGSRPCRFLNFPSAVLLSAIGRVFPYPTGLILFAFAAPFSFRRNVRMTSSILNHDKFRLKRLFPPDPPIRFFSTPSSDH